MYNYVLCATTHPSFFPSTAIDLKAGELIRLTSLLMVEYKVTDK